MTLDEAREKALEVRHLYDQLETKRYGRSWSTGEIALGLVGDVGDLAKLIMAHEGIRHIEGYEDKLGYELSDCLWSILVLAERCGIDLEKEFLKTMGELRQRISNQI